MSTTAQLRGMLKLLIATPSFIGASIGTTDTSRWGFPLAGAAGTTSLVVTTIWWSDARIGALLSAVVLISVVTLRRSVGGRSGGWLPSPSTLCVHGRGSAS